MMVGFAFVPIAFETALSTQWKGISGALAFCGMLLALATIRRVEWASFKTVAGQERLNIARAGPDRARFESFVEALSAAISASPKG
jgi:hypothetical protein